MAKSTPKKINLGIVGAAGRGGSFRRALEAVGTFKLHAICDLNAEGLAKTAADLGGDVLTFTDYQTMLDKGDVHAVIIGTPMHLHIPQSIAAIKRGIHALSEVTAGVSVKECKQLVQTCKSSKAVYMMAENYTYIQSNQVIKEMVRRGLFGNTYYAEGEYIHELKGLNEITKWRRKWQTGVNGITYGTHSLGPILQWMPGDRVASVTCAGSGQQFTDPRGDKYENEASCVMLCKMVSGGLVKIRVDMLSDRPHNMTNYHLQGSEGCYESGRAWGERNRVWLKSRSKGHGQWLDLETLSQEFMPQHWKRFEDAAKRAGHGGGDLIELLDFSDAITGVRPTPIGIHEAMDMTLPGLVSQESIAKAGKWLPVPDSRTW
jgi:predicted dehydrogenase